MRVNGSCGAGKLAVKQMAVKQQAEMAVKQQAGAPVVRSTFALFLIPSHLMLKVRQGRALRCAKQSVE